MKSDKSFDLKKIIVLEMCFKPIKTETASEFLDF